MNTSDILPLADLKADLRIDFDDDDTLLGGKLEAARRHVEAWCGPLEDFADGVPADLIEAMKLLAGHLYENREATYAGQGEVTEVPFGFHDLIGPYRKWEF
ncbi:head-tail connector protein [Ancylobacter sp. MQZ15Z-1]|uniref:Head-tail connector protein n=1 Tax=Ancylobacter mangrovi TaxID=2972472 RepID=A0A9X2P8S9_9HYPH|nr:head-tail connector protein [Ancylobacter mangrovi]MCS0494337.1 head-tail connector protein [Ancylobacter mangrovi]